MPWSIEQSVAMVHVLWNLHVLADNVPEAIIKVCHTASSDMLLT